jgi:hypothetical protein
MAEKKVWMWVSAGLLCGLIAASLVAVYCYGEYLKYQSFYTEISRDLEALTMHVSILIEYGNGTKEWHNNTRVPIGISLLNATQMIAEIDYDVSDGSAFVTAINNVVGGSDLYWLWYYWNPSTSQWELKWVASNEYILHNGDIVKWVYGKLEF